ncbi:MAG: hypothetical protein J6J31_05535 [Thermoguttaceae bacterium]|nr:hypothetical protein [Thermoguttaceae bacterium]
MFGFEDGSMFGDMGQNDLQDHICGGEDGYCDNSVHNIGDVNISIGRGYVADEISQMDPNDWTVNDLQAALDGLAQTLYEPSLMLSNFPDGNAAWYRYGDQEWINVNFDWMRDAVAKHGDGVLVSVLGHEFGHHYVENIANAQGWEITSWHHELGADFISGVIAAREGVDPDAISHFMRNDAICPSESHPDGYSRTGAAMQGYLWGKENLGEFTAQEAAGANNLVTSHLCRTTVQEALSKELATLFNNCPNGFTETESASLWEKVAGIFKKS